jgi:hypothetical protein
LLFLFGELLERFAPEVAQAELVRSMTALELGPLDTEDEDELLDALKGLRPKLRTENPASAGLSVVGPGGFEPPTNGL